MTDDKTTHILARLEIGFRTDSARLVALEEELAVTLQTARNFGAEHESNEDWNTNWSRQWDHVEGSLRQIREHVLAMDGSIASTDSNRLQGALEAWEKIQSENVKLAEALSALRAQAIGLNELARNDWNLLAQTLESHFATIQDCAKALRIKLELLKGHSKEEVDQLVQEILLKLPPRTPADGMDAESYRQEYRKAAAELEQESHKFLGFMDVVKSLFMWIETPEERVDKNTSPGVDRA